jgi:hypothetical protein
MARWEVRQEGVVRAGSEAGGAAVSGRAAGMKGGLPTGATGAEKRLRILRMSHPPAFHGDLRLKQAGRCGGTPGAAGFMRVRAVCGPGIFV